MTTATVSPSLWFRYHAPPRTGMFRPGNSRRAVVARLITEHAGTATGAESYDWFADLTHYGPDFDLAWADGNSIADVLTALGATDPPAFQWEASVWINASHVRLTRNRSRLAFAVETIRAAHSLPDSLDLCATDDPVLRRRAELLDSFVDLGFCPEDHFNTRFPQSVDFLRERYEETYEHIGADGFDALIA